MIRPTNLPQGSDEREAAPSVVEGTLPGSTETRRRRRSLPAPLSATLDADTRVLLLPLPEDVTGVARRRQVR